MSPGCLRLESPTFSPNADWVRALQRTAGIKFDSDRTLAVAIAEHARDLGRHPAFAATDFTLTYAELSRRATQYARWGLKQGLVKGERVALMLSNQPDYAAIWIGLGQIGVVTALLNTQLVGNGLSHTLALAGANHLIVGAENIEALSGVRYAGICWVHGAGRGNGRSIDEALAAIPGDPLRADEIVERVTLRDQALLIYTSGTTGFPKAARVSHYRVMMWSEWFAGATDATPEDRLYNCLPMYHSVGGVVAVGAMLVAGGTVITRTGFSASRFWSDLIGSGTTIFQYIGELCRYLLTAPADNVSASHQLRLCIGNGLRADVWNEFVERFSISRIIEFYASTEGSFSLFNLEGRPGAVGRIPRFIAHRSPVALVEFDDVRETPVRDANGFCRRCQVGMVGEAIGMVSHEASGLSTRFEGYTNETETQRKVLRNVFEPGDAWFRTGDLMRQDAAGFFYFVDRIGDTFRWKGENVATSEVADAIGACDGVLDVVVYGVAVPHADGRAGMAALVVGPKFDLSRLSAQLAARLPKAARPVFLRFRDQIDKTGTFKLRKQDLIAEGFDPTLTHDALYVVDTHEIAYVPLTSDCLARIASGEMKL